VKWTKPTTTTEVNSILGLVQYWRKFIARFSFITTPLHALTSVKQVFQWGGNKKKYFNILKENISTTPVLALPDLQHPFAIQIDARKYSMGVVLMQKSKPICYHSGNFTQVVIKYPID
jgi:hypothetical protein